MSDRQVLWIWIIAAIVCVIGIGVTRRAEARHRVACDAQNGQYKQVSRVAVCLSRDGRVLDVYP